MWGVNILLKFELPSSYCLWKTAFWRLWGKGWISNSVIYKVVCSTAPATPRLLNTTLWQKPKISEYSRYLPLGHTDSIFQDVYMKVWKSHGCCGQEAVCVATGWVMLAFTHNTLTSACIMTVIEGRQMKTEIAHGRVNRIHCVSNGWDVLTE